MKTLKIWNFFNHNFLSKYVVCYNCHQKIKYSRSSTTGMWSYYKNHHEFIYFILKSEILNNRSIDCSINNTKLINLKNNYIVESELIIAKLICNDNISLFRLIKSNTLRKLYSYKYNIEIPNSCSSLFILIKKISNYYKNKIFFEIII